MIGTIPFTPSWLRLDAKGKPAKNPPTFLLRAGSILERDQFEAELGGRHRAAQVPQFLLLDAAIAGVRALVPGDAGDELVELLRSDFGGGEAGGEGGGGEAGGVLAPLERAKIKQLDDILAKSWPEYAALVEQEARRNQILPTLAFCAWCAGWENVMDADGAPVEYARGPSGEFSDDLLRLVPFTMIRSAGVEAYAVQYGRTQAKN